MTKTTILALLLCGGIQAQAVITKTVCANGCDYPDPQTAERSLPASLSSTYVFLWQAGQSFQTTLIIRKLAMNGNWVIHPSSQSYALPTGVRAGAANLASMATLITPPGAPAIENEQGASYHRFEGLEIRSQTNGGFDPFHIVMLGYQMPGSAGLDDNQRSDLAHHIIFDRCYIHHWLDPNQGSGFSNSVFANTGYLELTNSTVMAFSTNNESHAVGSYNGEGPFVFQNNAFISSQVATIFGGNQPTITGIRARSVSFLGNYYYRPWLWRVTSGTGNPSGACQWDPNGGESYNQTASSHWWLCVSGVWSDQGAGTTPIPYALNYGASLDKNQFEIKNGWGFTVQGNTLQNGWQPAMLGQKGACVLLNQVDDTGFGRL